MNRTLNLPRAALCVLVALLTAQWSPPARAGALLVLRSSDIRASGATPAGEYRLTNGADDFGAFTDGLLSDDAAMARSAAQQHSLPEVDSGGVLSGASAEGSARASVDAGAEDAFSDAETSFDLVFRVEDRPALFTFDGTLSAGGDAFTGVSLFDSEAAEDPILISSEVTNETRTVRETALLEPGTYGLSVWSFARGTPAESFSSYAVSVSLRDGQGGVVPMPLPAAVWGGLAGLTLVGLLLVRARDAAAIV